MLREIAEADYGWKAIECDALLTPIWATGRLPPMDFNLLEVLHLIRWSEPEDPAWTPGGHGSRGHWMRLFACTVLLRLAAVYQDTAGSECDTVAQLVASAIALGEPVARASAGLLAWRFLTYPGESEDAAFLAFGILLLTVCTRQEEGRGTWLKELANWVEGEEAQAREAMAPCRASMARWDEWLLGLTFSHNLRESVWRHLALRILARPDVPHPPEAREALQLLGELVAGI